MKTGIHTSSNTRVNAVKDFKAVIKTELLHPPKKQLILKGWEKILTYYKYTLHDLINIFRIYPTYKDAIIALRKVIRLFKKVPGAAHYKIAKIAGNFWRVYYIPGWGTPVHNKHLFSQFNMFHSHGQNASRLLNVYFSVTKKCFLNCEHCSDWNKNDHHEDLPLLDLLTITDKLLECGTCSIHFTGGEPMLRIDDLITIIRYAEDKCLFWILTSGYNFTELNARRLKNAGLTGVAVSIDHYDENRHDRFRGTKGTHKQAVKAVEFTISRQMVAVLSVCLTRETANMDFLMKYMEFAKELGVAFVQILEPRSVGKYKGMDVELLPDQIKVVEEFFIMINKKRKFDDFPIVVYHENYMRRIGCLASGKSALYIDAKGDIRSCPFCGSKSGNALKDDIDAMANKLSNRSCITF